MTRANDHLINWLIKEKTHKLTKRSKAAKKNLL